MFLGKRSLLVLSLTIVTVTTVAAFSLPAASGLLSQAPVFIGLDASATQTSPRSTPKLVKNELLVNAAYAPLVTPIVWSGTTGTLWYTNTNWSPNTASTDWQITDLAQFQNAGSATTAGINMNTGPLSIGGIEVTSARTRPLTVGNSSSAPGTLTLNGTTINSVANVILRNGSGALLTVQDNETGSGKTMGLAIANPTENLVSVDGAGGITIGSAISGAGKNLTLAGSGTSVLTLSGTNTYTGITKISGGILSAATVANGGLNSGLGASTTAAANLVFDGGALRFAATGGKTNRNFTITPGKTATIDVPTDDDLTLSGGAASTNGNFTKTGGGFLTLTGVNAYTGATTIGTGGALALQNGGSIAASRSIEIQGGGFFDIGALTNSLTLSSGQALIASGTTSTGTITTSSTKGLTFASDSPLQFTAFNGNTAPNVAPLTVQGGGTVTLSSTQPVTVNTNSKLPAGTYTLLSKGSGTITGTAPTNLTISGSNVCDSCSTQLVINSNGLALVVTLPPAPTVAGISPMSGPTAGGTTVAIAGANFTAGSTVKFGAASASVTFNGSTSLTATSPVGSAGPVHVTVATAGGTSATSSADVFTYAVPTFAITPSAGVGGTISPSTVQTVNQGANSPPFTITPATGHHIATVLIDGVNNPVAVSTGSYTFIGVAQDHTISASFAVDTFQLTYSAGTGGTISGTSPQTVPYNGSGTTVTAIPNAHYHFTGWSDGVSTASRTDTNVQANVSVTANFAIDTYTITVTQAANGTIAPGTSTVNYGDSPAFTITPASGFQIASLTVDGNPVTPATSYTFTSVSTDHTITATYTSSAVVSTEDQNASHDQNVTIPVKTSDLTGSGVISGQFTFTYDETVLDPAAGNISVTAGTVLPTGAQAPTIDVNMGTAGVVYVSIYGAYPFAGAGTVVDIHMRVKGVAPHATSLALSDFLYNGGVVSATATNGTLTVVKSNQTITVTDATPSTVPYGSTFTASAMASSGLPVAISTAGSCTGGGTASAAVTITQGAGTCHVFYDQTGDTLFNAAPQITRDTNAVKADQTIAFNALTDKTYGDANFGVSATASSGLAVSFTSQTPLVCSIVSGTSVHILAAETCTVRASQGGDANYNAAAFVDHSFNVGARTLTVSATGQNKPYDGNADATVTLSTDAINGDVVDVAYTTATFSDKNFGNGKTVSVSGISITGGAQAANYTLGNTTTSTTADITKRDLHVTATGVNKAYDGNATATATLSTDKVSGDDVTAAYTSALFPDKNVGTARSVSVTGISIGGSDAGNYNLVNTTTSTIANIGVRTLTVTATGVNRPYDGTTVATVTLGDDRVSGDDVTTAYTSAAFGDKNVANIKPVSVTGISITGGLDQANYSLGNTTASTTANITARSATWTTNNASKTFGVTDPSPLTTGSGSNFVPGDGVSATYSRVSGEAVSPPTYHITATLTATLPADLNNYTITNNGAELTINSRVLSGQVLYKNAATPSVGIPQVAVAAAGSPAVSSSLTDSDGKYTLAGFGTGSYDISLSKPSLACSSHNGIFAMDASLISQHVVHLITLTPTQQEAARVSGLPNVTAFDASLIAQYLVCIPNASSTGTWTFDSYSSAVGASDNHDFHGLLKGDVDGDWSATGAQTRPQLAATALGMDATRVSLADVAAMQGSQVTVPVRLDNLKGAGVVAYEFDIAYDPTVLSTGQGAASLEGTLSTGLAVASNSPEPGLLKVVVYGALPVSGDGVYVKLNFAAIGESGSVSPLAIRGFTLNDGRTHVLTQNGSVSINAATGPMFGGRVVTSTGAPIRNARVAITTTTGQTVFALSNAFGYVTVSGLTPGETYTLTTTARGFAFAPVTVSASPGLTQVEIVAQP